MENKREIYVCGVCGSVHATIADRAKCEFACITKQEEEAAKAAEVKKQEEYKARVAEVDEAFSHAYDLRNKLYADYGAPYMYNHRKFDDDLPYTLLSWVL